MITLPPRWVARMQQRCRCSGLAGGGALPGDSMPWSIALRTTCVSGSISSSISSLSSSVSCALGAQLHLLAEARRDVVDHAREAAEDELHRHHADRHHRLLQVARVAVERGEAVREVLVLLLGEPRRPTAASSPARSPARRPGSRCGRSSRRSRGSTTESPRARGLRSPGAGRRSAARRSRTSRAAARGDRSLRAAAPSSNRP